MGLPQSAQINLSFGLIWITLWSIVGAVPAAVPVPTFVPEVRLLIWGRTGSRFPMVAPDLTMS
jgi:hypothetical protein